MAHETHPLVVRWRGFIDKPFARLQEIESESAQGLAGLRESAPTDYTQYSGVFGGLDNRVSQLKDKLDSTWEDNVEPQFEDGDDSTSGLLDAGLDLKSWAEIEIDAHWAQFQATQAAEFYRSLEPTARGQIPRSVPCTQCGSPVVAPDPFAMQSVSCSSCSAVNQVAPTPELSAYAGFATAYAEEQVVKLRFDVERFRREVDMAQRAKRERDDDSNEGLASLERWEQMERAYWQKYAELVAQHSGKPIDQAWVDARLKQFYMYTLESEQEWVSKHGRRSQQM
ncbi:MAG: hypothetical protein JKY37_04940 [Nannocystaceae bacterium]|nr:hypothetical protein [Nannocystaceae bacterium]